MADSLDSGSSVHYVRAGSSPASRTTSSRTSYRSRRRFLFQSKRRLSFTPSLLLSKSKPHGRFMPRRQLRHSAVLGFDFVLESGIFSGKVSQKSRKPIRACGVFEQQGFESCPKAPVGLSSTSSKTGRYHYFFFAFPAAEKKCTRIPYSVPKKTVQFFMNWTVFGIF